MYYFNISKIRKKWFEYASVLKEFLIIKICISLNMSATKIFLKKKKNPSKNMTIPKIF